MTLKFRWETIDRFLEEGVEDLITAHWEEVATDKDVIPLAPDWDDYRALEKLGSFKALGAWRKDRLIGYNAFFVTPHKHYRYSVFALNDILYIDPDERGEAGIRVILTAERDLFRQGTRKILYHSKPELLLAAGGSGGKRDSLDALETLLEIEEEFGLTLPDEVVTGGRTLGGLLWHLGYEHFEDVWSKTRRD